VAEVEDGRGIEQRREIAAQAIDPCVTNAAVVAAFWNGTSDGIDPQASYEAIRAQVQQVREGRLSSAEATLVGQAAALNAIFVDLAQRGHASLDRPGNAAERYLRLAMRAQNQCRETLTALAAVANRPSKAAEQHQPIMRIERVIIRPKPYIEGKPVQPEEGPYPAANAAGEEADVGAYSEGRTNGSGWENWANGARLDGGAARGSGADDAGTQAVGAFDRAAYG
jgi:hypothetical protein